MTNQNLYAAEGNDRGWYRVEQENKKLKKGNETLKIALASNVLAVANRNREITKLREALTDVRKFTEDADSPFHVRIWKIDCLVDDVLKEYE